MQHRAKVESDRFLTQRDLADRWGCSPRTLQRWRTSSHGPAFVRLGGSVRYLLSDVVAFEVNNRTAGMEA